MTLKCYTIETQRWNVHHLGRGRRSKLIQKGKKCFFFLSPLKRTITFLKSQEQRYPSATLGNVKMVIYWRKKDAAMAQVITLCVVKCARLASGPVWVFYLSALTTRQKTTNVHKT